MLLTLLPLATWANKPTAANTPAVKAAQEWTNQPLGLVETAVKLPDGYDTSVGRVYYIALLSSQAAPIKSNPGWSTDLPTRTDINKYKVYYYITNDGTASYDEDGDVTLIETAEITKATIKVANITSPVAAVPDANRKYNGGEAVNLVTAPEFTGIISDEIITEYSVDGGAWSETIPTATVCGSDVTIKWRTKETTHYESYTAGADVTTSLKKADLTTGDITLPTVISPLKYTGQKQQIFSSPGVSTLGTVYFNVNDQGFGFVVTDDKAKANLTPGTYQIPYYVVASDPTNYNNLGDAFNPAGNIQVTIANGQATATEPTLVSGWTYDGSEHSLLATAGSATNGTLVYYLGESETPLTQADVKALNAGTYTVSYSVTGDTYFDGIAKQTLGTTVTIAQKPLTVSAQKVEVNWTGDPINYNEQQMVLAKTSEWAAADNDEAARKALLAQMLTVTIPDNATDAGDYEFSVAETSGQKTNYKPEILVSSNKLIIKQVASTMTTAPVAATGLVYDGNAKTLVDASGAVFNGGKLVYSLTETGDYVENTEDLDVKNAGTHSVWCKVQGDKNHLDTTPEEIAGIQISASSAQTFGEWTDGGFTFGETAVLPTVAATYEDAEISYQYKKGADGTYGAAPAKWTAGTWYAKATAAATANYAEAVNAVEKEFVVSAAAQTFGAWTKTQGFVYGSEAVLPEITANENPVITYTYKKEGEAEFAEAPAEWTAGTWFVKAAAAATANYAAAETDGTQTFVVSQKPVTPVAPAAIALTYNGLAQELVTAGSAEGATIQYALGEGEFGDAIPTAKDAGTYTVKYKFTVDDNYSFTPTEGEVNVKINKAHLAYSLGNQTATYTGEAIAPVLGQAYDLADGDLMVGDDEAFTLSFPATEAKNFTDVATYNFSKLNVTWNEGFKENYTIQFYNNGSLTIEKAAITDADFNDPKAVGGAITYDGNAQTLFNAGSWKDDKNFGIFMYSEDNENWSTEIADKTDAGTYNLYWKIVADDNHLDFNSADHLTKTIVAKTWNAQVPAFFDDDLVKVYAKGHNYLSDLEGALDLFDGTTALTADDYELVITNTQIDPETEEPVVATEAINADTYTFTYTGKGNYAGNETAWTLTIDKAELVDNFALSATEAEYSSEDQLPTLTAAAGLEKDVDFTVDAPAKAINVGEYNFTITPGKNYYLTGKAENYTKTFKITPATVLISAGNCEKVYNGEAGLAGATKPELLFAGIKKNDKAEEVITKKDAEAYGVTVAEASKNFGTYALNIDLDAFAVANNNYVLAANSVQGTLTISKKDLAIAFNDHDAEGNYLIQKNYGEADNFAEVADLVTLEGAVDADAADIIDGIKVTRSNATENSVGKYEDVLEIATEGDVFANYNVDATAKGDFEIVAGTLTIALKTALTKVYDGDAPANTLEITAADLAVTGMDEGDKIEDIFTTLPTVTVQNGAKDAATYVVKLSGGVAPNYNLEEATYLDGQYIITPKELTATVGTQIVSVEATELPNANGFSIEGAVEGDDLKAKLKINASTEAAGTFDDGILLTINNANYTLKNNTGKLIVVDAAADGLVFDTNTVDIVETLQASNGAKCDITIKGRSTNNNGIEAKKWIGMVLPFDVTVEELVEVFGYSIINTYDAENSSAAHMKFQVEQDGIPANTPFIIKPKKNISAAEGFTFKNVTIDAPATASVSVKVGGNSFVGQYEAYTIEKKETPNSTYLRDGGWKRAKNSDRVIVPFDCYITWPEGVSAPSISIEDEGGVTKIATITTDGRIIEAEGWYTVNGMKLDAAPTEKGVYIKDGKKVVIK